MNHILLESQEEAVKRFFLKLSADTQGTVIEWNGLQICPGRVQL